MQPLVANTDDLISVLDRVLDKGIVLDKWACLSLQESGLIAADSRIPSDSRITVESSAVYVATAREARGGKTWNWKIYFPSGGASFGANSFPAQLPKNWKSHC